jgi:hypothetical protein
MFGLICRVFQWMNMITVYYFITLGWESSPLGGRGVEGFFSENESNWCASHEAFWLLLLLVWDLVNTVLERSSMKTSHLSFIQFHNLLEFVCRIHTLRFAKPKWLTCTINITPSHRRSTFHTYFSNVINQQPSDIGETSNTINTGVDFLFWPKSRLVCGKSNSFKWISSHDQSHV